MNGENPEAVMHQVQAELANAYAQVRLDTATNDDARVARMRQITYRRSPSLSHAARRSLVADAIPLLALAIRRSSSRRCGRSVSRSASRSRVAA